MSITLKKGGSLNLSKKEPSLKKVLIGLGWEMKPGAKLDLDGSVFLLDQTGKIPEDEFLVFYNNLKSPDGAVQHTGDNRTGETDGDDEVVLLNLPLLDDRITDIVVAVTIHEASRRRHHFGLLQDAYIRILDMETKKEIIRYDLDEANSTDTDMEFGRLEKKDGEWTFYATGIGYSGGLQTFVDKYV